MAGLVAAAVTGCGGAGKGANVKTRLAVSRSDNSATGYEVLSLLFPQSGADAAAGVQVVNFDSAYRDRLITKCLAERGLPGAPGELPDGIGINTEFPDMASIARSHATGFLTSYPNPSDPGASMPKIERKAYERDVLRCRGSIPDPLQTSEESPATQSLRTVWSNDLSQIDTSVTAESLSHKARECSERAGFPFPPRPGADVASFVLTLDSRETKLLLKHKTARAKWLDTRASRTFVSCFTPLEAALDKERAARHAAFFRQNAIAIDALRRRVSSAVEQMARTLSR